MELTRPLSTVTPTLDGDVLAVLALHDSTFTIAQLHRILDSHSEEGIRKVLRRLVGQGVVDGDQVGRTFTYQLNRDHLAAEHIVGLARMREEFLRRLENRLISWEVPPAYAAVFGSMARGSMTMESDVDLLLIRPENARAETWREQVTGLVADVTRWIGNDVRPLEFDIAELHTHGHAEAVLRDVLAGGLTIAGTRSWLAEKVNRE